MDFDPTTEEGQVDINDEEYDALIPNDNVDPEGLFDKLTRRFGDRARSAWDILLLGENGKRVTPTGTFRNTCNCKLSTR